MKNEKYRLTFIKAVKGGHQSSLQKLPGRDIQFNQRNSKRLGF